MGVGSLGILYCSETESLTTPFIVYTPVDFHRVVTDVWPEAWALPFHIQPLGTPRRSLHRADAMVGLEVLRSSGRTNFSQALPVTGTTVFTPKAVPVTDWALLLEALTE
jgi:hypothetical protein